VRLELRFISAAEVEAALPMRAAIDAMKRAFVLLSADEVEMPPRTAIEAPKRGGNLLFMPAYAAADDRYSVKVVSLFAGNPARGLPLIQSIVTLFDGVTGRPLAVIDGTSLTALRTGAASGAATETLAREDAAIVAIFGAGAQARTQLEAVCAARRITLARVYTPEAALGERFAREMSFRLGIEIVAAKEPREALVGAAVVCTATVSGTPVFDDRDLEPGTHINAIGSYKPERREIPGSTAARSRIFVDHRDSARAEAGDLLIPLREGLIRGDEEWTELGEVIAGRRPGRASPDEITLFKSVGVAIQDLVGAEAVLAGAERLGLGTMVQL